MPNVHSHPDRLVYRVRQTFEAARQLRGCASNDVRARPHGHGFQVLADSALPKHWAPFPGAELGELTAKLAQAVTALDYRDLNALLRSPSDAHLAQHIHTISGIPGLETVSVQSTPRHGSTYQGNRYAVWRSYRVEAAHWLPKVPAGHPCGRLHGHGFEIRLDADVTADTADGDEGYRQLDAAVAPIAATLDYVCLNDIAGLTIPTSELFAEWLWQRLKPELPGLNRVSVHETPQSGASYDGLRFTIFRDFNLDSAVALTEAAPGDPRRRIHGHTYRLRLALSAPIDRVLGWTIDFGDVKRLFAPIAALLDHQPLHELPTLAHADIASIVRWIRAQTLPILPAMDHLELYETPNAGVLLSR